jgi:hypothetical protein
MTQLYEAGVTKTTTAAAGPIVTLLAPSTARPDIREIGIFIAPTAAAAIVGLGRPAAVGAGAATGTLGQAMDAADPTALCTLTTSFATTQPTAPTNFFRRVDLPATVGAGLIWVWGINELSVPQSGNLVLWQISTAIVTYDVYVKWEE